MEIPLLIRVDVPFTTFDPDAPDAQIYCVNETQNPFEINSNSTSFTAIDEELGESISHGSAPVKKIILQGESALIADVLGWEWDGFVGLELTFINLTEKKSIVKNYNLKSGSGDYFSENSDLSGRIIPPLN